MARHDLFMEMVVDYVAIAQGKVRAADVTGGTNVLEAACEAAGNWVRGLNLTDPLNLDVQLIGQRTPKLIFYGRRVTIYVIPALNPDRQCRDCGYPSDEPNSFCLGQCVEFFMVHEQDEQRVREFYAERRVA